jgi:soluble cytochrome b562
MYGNPYSNLYNVQPTIDTINNNIAELEKMRNQIQNRQQQMPQPTSLTQNFQIAPTNTGTMKFAGTIDEVNKEIVMADTPFFSKDLSVLWIKNPKGEIKSYELKEIVQKDEKDLMIENLQAQIQDLRKEMTINAKSSYANDVESIEDEKSTNVSNVRKGKTK